MSEHKLLEEFQAYCDEQLIKPRNIYFQFWRDSRASLNAELERVVALNHQQFGDAIRQNAEIEKLRKECERLAEDNRGLLEDFEGAL